MIASIIDRPVEGLETTNTGISRSQRRQLGATLEVLSNRGSVETEVPVPKPPKRRANESEKRLYGLFKAHPTTPYKTIEVKNELRDLSSALVDQLLKRLVVSKVLIKPAYGMYMLNPNPPMTLAEAQQLVLEKGRERVIDSGRPWAATEQVIQARDNPTVPVRRAWLRSILARMIADNGKYSKFDVDFLEGELKHILEDPKIIPVA